MTEAIADAEKADREAQQKADKEWNHRLVRLRDELASGVAGKREEARRDLAGVSDPRAVPMVWKVFVAKGEKHHLDAVQILGQIDAGDSSRGLALLALASKNAVARRRAVETLRRRDPREYTGMLISMIGEKIKFEVKPVAGPGSQGVLYIVGKEANLKRLYTPGQVPQIVAGDRLGYDSQGRLVAIRQVGSAYSTGRIRVGDMGPELFNAAYQYNYNNRIASAYGGGDGQDGVSGADFRRPRSVISDDTAIGPATPGSRAVEANIARSLTPQMGGQAAASASAFVSGYGQAMQANVAPYNRRNAVQTFPRGQDTGYLFGLAPSVSIPVEQMAVRRGEVGQSRPGATEARRPGPRTDERRDCSVERTGREHPLVSHG